MTGHDIRAKYLNFFSGKGHKVVPSDSLVPKDDPTVLFTTAGMQQFKPQFLGNLTGFTRAASSQKCLRTDDLKEVGVTDFHHTFFEMLGNFSFGDYFKREAIAWAWEFLTVVMGIDPEKLWVSVHQDDEEAYAVWLNEVKVPAERIVKLGDRSNFWPSNARLNGPNGPCGPCSEIFFDWGRKDCPNPKCDPDCSCGRFCEVWNLVFTQYNRCEGGILEPLPAKNIDTGMGLERLTAVMQGKRNNFETDLFMPVIEAVTAILKSMDATVTLKEARVIADHARAVTFGLADGVVPSNEGRGYVMRRLIVDMTNMVLAAGLKRPVVHMFIPSVVAVMKGAYPELGSREADVVASVKRVEEAVIRLNGEKAPELVAELEDIHARKSVTPQLVGEVMFRYRDTYGLPMNLIQDKVREMFKADLLHQADAVAQRLMEEQKERSRAGSKMQGDVFLSGEIDVKELPKTAFLGYDQPSADASILALFAGGRRTDEARDAEAVTLVLDQTPFYAEQGGQVADTGRIQGKHGTMDVTHTRKINDVYVHQGVVKGVLNARETVRASIDGERRLAIMRNHTATHLLQAALRMVLGEHVKQQGSLVDEKKLRFDFTHPKALSRGELDRVEDAVNSFIRRSDVVVKKTMTISEARSSGALAFFAEKYADEVRVVSAGDYSGEFCGGTHVAVTGQIGLCKIVSEGAVAQGIRRIEALTGSAALEHIRQRDEQLAKAAMLLKAPVEEFVPRLEQQNRRIKELEKELGDLRFESLRASLEDIIGKAEAVKGTAFISYIFKDADMDRLRRVSDLIRQKRSSFAAVLAATSSGDGALVISLSGDLVKKGLKASELMARVTPLFSGSGGGRPDMAQSGCKDPGKLITSFEAVKKIIEDAIV
jgi:alanyl-tRNA synthetase